MEAMRVEFAGGASLEWAAASRALVPGAHGDEFVVHRAERGAMLAVIDGLGHGPEAAVAARTAAAVVRQYADSPLELVIDRCHAALRSTRGAVMSLAFVSPDGPELCWTGIGNVDALLIGTAKSERDARVALTPRGGIVGFRYPKVRSVRHPMFDADRLIFATDGIRAEFADRLVVDGDPGEVANRILNLHARGTDDAIVLVARFSTANGGDRGRLPTDA